MQKAKITIAAAGLVAAVAFSATGALKDNSIVQRAEAAAAIDTTGYMAIGPFSSSVAQTDFLRLGNASTAPATFTVLAANPAGVVTAQPLTVTVPPYGVAIPSLAPLLTQFPTDVNVLRGFTSSGSQSNITIYVKSDLAGKGAMVQLLSGRSHGITPLTHCVYDSSLTYDASVGTVFLGIPGPAFRTYISYLLISNPDSKSRIVAGSYYDAKSGSHIDELYPITIPANGSVTVNISLTSAQTLADPKNPSAATALGGLASATDYIDLVIRSGDSSALTAIVNPVAYTPDGVREAISEFCPVNPKHGSSAVSPSGS